ncbi:hypothetical protein CL618_00955 [archaeon]|nr:hypothetical protein [archaeon]|tara:strand:- start:2966 stop:3577 length:612 start_codon:yes stop_codon:yes gene_type:complete
MKILTHIESEKLFNLPYPKSSLTSSLEEALKTKLEFPLVLKIISEKIIHKTEENAVIETSKEELEENYNKLIKICQKKKIKPSILLQETMQGQEIIIGIKKDPTFNHVILLGLGGFFVELIKDISFRKCPITKEDAESMINDLKNKQILTGFRNQSINLEILKDLLVKVSKLPEKHDIQELDLNPVIINKKQAQIVDVRTVLQ